jgi:PAS domain S-box-containing protein
VAPELEDLQAIWLDLHAHVDSLAADRQHYLDFFEQSPEAYVVTDAGGVIREANGAAVDLLQQRKRYLRGRPFSSLVALDHRGAFRRAVASLALGEGAQAAFSTVVVAAGSRVQLALRPRVMAGAASSPAGICWLLQAA